jgi:iron complex transport system substrate-binding protein
LADVEAVVARLPAGRRPRIVSLNPTSLSDVLNEINLLGAAAGAAERAIEYLQQLNARIETVRRLTSNIAEALPPRRVAMVEWIEPLMLSGNWLPELIALAGGEHRLTNAGQHSLYVAWDDVVQYDPEVVIIAPCGFSLERTLEEVPLLTTLPHWEQLAAVRGGRVYAMDGNAYLNRSGPRLVDSLEILAHLFYPEQIKAPAGIAALHGVWRRLDGEQNRS